MSTQSSPSLASFRYPLVLCRRDQPCGAADWPEFYGTGLLLEVPLDLGGDARRGGRRLAHEFTHGVDERVAFGGIGERGDVDADVVRGAAARGVGQERR